MAALRAVSADPNERLRHLAVVFSVELRLKIVAELYMREMSARQFYEEFGGGASSRVNQNFTALAEENWLRLVRKEGPGGPRHGGVELYYRAPEPPYFDVESWGLVPYSVRVAASLNLFRQIAPRIQQDLELAARGSEYKRDLSCTPVLLDERGWKRAIAAVSAVFARVHEEQEDARRRTLHSGEKLMQADVLLFAFQAPNGGRATGRDILVERRRAPATPFPERLAPILKDEVRRGVISELNQREMSVTQFHRELGGASKVAIGRRFKGLEGGGWVAKGITRTGGSRRGAREQFYRATKPPIKDYEPLTNPPPPSKRTENWQVFEYLCSTVKEAMLAGTFDLRKDRFVSLSMLRLDREGWENVLIEMESLYESIMNEQRPAAERIQKSGEKPTTLMLSMGAFEASKDTVKAP